MTLHYGERERSQRGVDKHKNSHTHTHTITLTNKKIFKKKTQRTHKTQMSRTTFKLTLITVSHIHNTIHTSMFVHTPQ